jgi:signal transduction histidine kinase
MLTGFFVFWSGVVLVVGCWLFQPAHPQAPLVITQSAPLGTSWAPRVHQWFELFRLNFYWAWGWALLAPYVLWLGSYCYLERGRLLRRAPVLLAAACGFVWGAQTVEKRAGPGYDVVVVGLFKTFATGFEEEGVPSKRNGIFSTSTTSSNIIVTKIGNQDGPGNRIVISSTSTNLGPANQTAGQSLAQPGARPWQGTSALVGNPPSPGRLPGADPASGLAPGLASNLAPLFEGHWQADLPSLGGGHRLPLSAGLDALAYLGLLALAHATVFHRRSRERGQQAALLSSRLNQARLRALQAQLQPHFLFNALNGIATLVRDDPAAAQDMLASLSELLRLGLNQSERQQIPLREEIEFVDRYLEIQQMRFGERLRVEKQFEPAALDCVVPALLLQPLVENAIQHGIEPSPNAGLVRIRAACSGGQIVLSVEDDGAGLPAGQGDGAWGLPLGVGLSNVRERLESLYPGRHQFDVRARTGGGVWACVRLPFQPPNAVERPLPPAGT